MPQKKLSFDQKKKLLNYYKRSPAKRISVERFAEKNAMSVHTVRSAASWEVRRKMKAQNAVTTLNKEHRESAAASLRRLPRAAKKLVSTRSAQRLTAAARKKRKTERRKKILANRLQDGENEIYASQNLSRIVSSGNLYR